jgi:hypothetical protein
MKFTFLVLRTYIIPAPNQTLVNLNEYKDRYKEGFWRGLQHDIERCAMHASEKLDIVALQWASQSLSDPSELEPLVTAIPGFLGPPTITSKATIPLHFLLYANDADLGLRIGHLLTTKMDMPIACIDALWHLTYWHNAIDVWEWATAFGKVTVESLNMLKGSRDPAIALTAHCTAALAVRVMLKDLHRIVPVEAGVDVPTDTRVDVPVDTRVDGLRKALHLFMDLDWGVLPDDDLIRDGHVLNMAGILTSATPFVARVDESRASVLWDTLDILRSDQDADSRKTSLQPLDARQASSQAQIALVSAWEVYESEYQAWTSAAGGIPYQPLATPSSSPTTAPAPVIPAAAATPAVAATTTSPAPTISKRCVDRYKSRMEVLVAPIVTPVRGITSE